MFNDLLILAKIKEGDVKAFEEVFRLYYIPLCMYAICITGQSDVAEEIVQELFYVFWRDKNKLQLLRSVKSYLYGAVHNQSLQYLEHENVKKQYNNYVLAAQTDEDVLSRDPQNQMEYKELEGVIADTLRMLPERSSLIFRMQRIEGKKYAEIAKELQISVKTVEAEMSKTLKILRKEVGSYYNLKMER